MRSFTAMEWSRALRATRKRMPRVRIATGMTRADCVQHVPWTHQLVVVLNCRVFPLVVVVVAWLRLGAVWTLAANQCTHALVVVGCCATKTHVTPLVLVTTGNDGRVFPTRPASRTINAVKSTATIALGADRCTKCAHWQCVSREHRLKTCFDHAVHHVLHDFGHIDRAQCGPIGGIGTEHNVPRSASSAGSRVAGTFERRLFLGRHRSGCCSLQRHRGGRKKEKSRDMFNLCKIVPEIPG